MIATVIDVVAYDNKMHIDRVLGFLLTFFLPLDLDEDWAANNLAAFDFWTFGG